MSGPPPGLRVLLRGGQEAAVLSQPPRNPSVGGHLQIDSLPRGLAGAGGSGGAGRGRRPAVQGERAVGGDVGPRTPAGGERGGGRGMLSRHSACACCYLHPAEACPGPAFPEPQAAGLGGGGLCPPFFWQEPSVRFPHPVGLRQAQARGVRLGLPQGPMTQRDASPSLMWPGRSKVSLPQPRGPRVFPRVRARPGTGSHHFPPWSWPPSLTRHLPSAWGGPPPASPQGRSAGLQRCLGPCGARSEDESESESRSVVSSSLQLLGQRGARSAGVCQVG